MEAKYRLRVEPTDFELENPRLSYAMGTLAIRQSGYTMGDQSDLALSVPIDFDRAYENISGRNEEYLESPILTASSEAWKLVTDKLREDYGTTVVLPVFVFDHSGRTYSAGDAESVGDEYANGQFTGDGAGWDTSFVGIIFDTKKGRELAEIADDQVESVLRSEVEEYSRWASNDYYGYTIETRCACCGAWSHHDSCVGYWTEEEARDEGESDLLSCVERDQRESYKLFTATGRLQPLKNGAFPVAEHKDIVLAITSSGEYVTWYLVGEDRDTYHGEYFGHQFKAAVAGFEKRSGQRK